MTREVKINGKKFNNVFYHLKNAFSNTLIRFIWVYGGSSASKSYSVVQLQVLKMLEGEGENALILRKFAVDIKDSIFQDFKTIITNLGFTDYFIIQQNYIECKRSKSYVRFRGLDDSEKIKGISGFKRVILEEVSQFDEVDFKQIKKRLRGQLGQQIIGIFNPISEDHWIKKNVFDLETLSEKESDISGMWVNEQGNLVILKTNYLDNRFIVGPNFVDQHVIDDFEKDKTTDFGYYQVYGLGNWGVLKTGGEFWPSFDVSKHVKKIAVAQSTIHVSLDDNNDPYVTQTIWQIFPSEKKLKQVGEILSKAPNNNAPKAAKQFAEYLLSINYQDTLFIYGDPSAGARSTIDPNNASFYDKYIDVLKGYGFSIIKRVGRSAPEVSLSGDFINAIYETNYGGWSIEISDKCTTSIGDYMVVKKDADGKMFKPKVKNKETGVTYEPHGHISDTKRYLCTTLLANDWNIFKARGRRAGSIAA